MRRSAPTSDVRVVAVVGPADAPEPIYAAARRVGLLLAGRGVTVGLLPGPRASGRNLYLTVAIAPEDAVELVLRD